jgi:hypothetical protein
MVLNEIGLIIRKKRTTERKKDMTRLNSDVAGVVLSQTCLALPEPYLTASIPTITMKN